MKRNIIMAILASLLVCFFVGGGYGLGYTIYELKIQSYETQVADLTSEVSILSQTISYLETQVSTVEGEKSSLRTTLNAATAQAQSYREQATTLESQLSGSQERLNNILGITVTQYYQWYYGRGTWHWELPIPLSVYVEYLERPRPDSVSDYVDMAIDPEDDPYIDSVVRGITEAALAEHFNEIQKLNFVIAFAQSLPYTVDEETTARDEYPRYPVETLFDRGGDCEDTSILVAALLDRLGYDVALILLENAHHMAVGVSLTGTYGTYYNHNDKKYFYLETTGEGWQVGQIPPTITDTRASIYQLRS